VRIDERWYLFRGTFIWGLVVGNLLHWTCRALWGPTHEASVASAELALAGFMVTTLLLGVFHFMNHHALSRRGGGPDRPRPPVQP
jgi:hypothetical protein